MVINTIVRNTALPYTTDPIRADQSIPPFTIQGKQVTLIAIQVTRPSKKTINVYRLGDDRVLLTNDTKNVPVFLYMDVKDEDMEFHAKMLIDRADPDWIRRNNYEFVS